jgi:hypothetical protein
MKTCLTFVIIFLTGLPIIAQQLAISGNVKDDHGKSVPFASVFVKGTTRGTSANSEGAYRLNLPAGNYELIFKAIGYGQQSRKIDLAAARVLDVTLSAETYELKGVNISSGSEDPAYAIVRKAIKKRKSHLKEVNAYTCEVYIKGLQKLLAAPKKFLGRDLNQLGREIGLDSNRRGILYLSESESKYSFEAPDHVHEEMISSKVSGSNRAFSFNRASDMVFNFYQNLENLQGLSNRPLVSPIADDALLYYRYKWLGITIENGETVNKIQVIPRREHDPCFEGYIYILDDSWRIYSLDLVITKKANINIVDTLRFSQQFFPVSEGKWMQASNKFEFSGGLLGFRFGGYFISVYKDYDLHPQFNSGEFKEVLRITRQVNKIDSNYWNKERPVPLTAEEKTDYQKKAILAEKRESKPYLDSLDRVNNKLNPVNLFLTGYTYFDRYHFQSVHFNSLLGALNFNTVQGFVFDYGVTYVHRTDSTDSRLSGFDNHNFIVSAKAGYGFSNRVATGSAGVIFPIRDFTVNINGGSDIVDLNNQSPISPLLNSFHSLFQRKNYEKLYQKQFASGTLGGRIAGGWQASLTAEFADRKSLPNTSTYSFVHPANRQYTSNNPFTPNVETLLFPENKSFKITFRTTYDFSNKYETYPIGRRYLPSPYPTIGFTFIKAVKDVFGSDADYSRASFDIGKQNISMGMFGRTSFYAEAGKFFDVKRIYYPDYKQFEGLEGTFYRPTLNRFLLLNYYLYSAPDQYVEGHLEHNFSGFITNKLPGIRKLKLQEIVDFNYLDTPQLKNYGEIGFGLQYLNFRLIYGRSFHSGNNMTSGLKLGVYL